MPKPKLHSKWSKPNRSNKSPMISSAIALSYKSEDGASPQVVAKGNNVVAEEMKRIARRYGVPTYKSDRLVGKLKKLEVSSDIPQDLYGDVAKVFLSLEVAGKFCK